MGKPFRTAWALAARLAVLVPRLWAGQRVREHASMQEGEADIERLVSACWLSAPAAHSGIRRVR